MKLKDVKGNFLYEAEVETEKELIEIAISNNKYLYEANLVGADLSSANLRGADLSRVDMRWADLSGADLRGANLIGADMRGANLIGADMSRANLRGADLRGADLSRVDMRWANLRGANLIGADMRGADMSSVDLPLIGDLKRIRSMQVDTYTVAYTKNIIRIGCRQHTIEEWRNFSDSEISDMYNESIEWWRKWKDFIFKAIELSFEKEA